MNVRDLNRADWESGPDRKLAHNTYRVTLEDGRKGVRYHSTVIVAQGDWDGVYILNSGGYRTSTTKQRINALLPFVYVSQRNWEWFVTTRNSGEVPFSDGMKVTASYARF